MLTLRIENMPKSVAGLKSLPARPTTRIRLDAGASAVPGFLGAERPSEPTSGDLSMRTFLCVSALAALLTLPLVSAAQTTDVSGVKFANTIQVGNSTLQMNGAGVRYKVVFKVYAAALYLAEKAATPEAALAAPGPAICRS